MFESVCRRFAVMSSLMRGLANAADGILTDYTNAISAEGHQELDAIIAEKVRATKPLQAYVGDVAKGMTILTGLIGDVCCALDVADGLTNPRQS